MKVALIGYGRMGQQIKRLLDNSLDEVVLIIDRNNFEDLTIDNLKNADVAIEFTTPDTAFDNIKKCIDAQVPVVSGTTGWLDKFDKIEKYCKDNNGSLFYASNFSIGMSIFFEINSRLASLMNNYPQYQTTIEEVHHTKKVDAPSGTAITIAQQIIKNVDRKEYWVNTSSVLEKELAIASIRRSNVNGIHIITWESEVDMVKIEHTAKSREGFAIGAITAANFIKNKKGVYSMRDLLNL